MPRGTTDPRTVAVRVSALWHPADVSDPILLAFYRLWLVSFPLGGAALIVGIAAFGAAIARRPFTNEKTLVLLIVMGLVPVSIRHSMHLMSVARLGYLTRRGVP